jgi:hypothetical protein
MSLADLWSISRKQLEGKQVRQIIAFAGGGQLTDGGAGAAEFREFLGQVPSDYLSRYAEECLGESFPGSGFALQDIVNQIGRRLGYTVTDGRYRGTTKQIGLTGFGSFLMAIWLSQRLRLRMPIVSTLKQLPLIVAN